MALNLSKVSELEKQPWVILIYGPPGVGKTVFAAGASKPVFLMLDRGGDRSLLNHAHSRDALVVRCTKLEGVAHAMRDLAAEIKAGLDVDTIILDSVTELQENDRNAQAAKSGDLLLDPKWKFNEHIYTVNNFRVGQALRELIALGKNVIIIAHVKEELIGNDASRTVMVRPSLSPSLLSGVMARIDGAFYLSQTGSNRTLRIHGAGDATVKSRFTSKLPALTNPTFQQLQEILES